MKLSEYFTKKPERLVVAIMLPLILVVCLGLTHFLSLDKASELVESNDGVWDLREYDLSNEGVQISGDVEYIPNELLTPKEYKKRKKEAVLSDEAFPEQYGTSRIVLKMPSNGWYTFSRISIDYSERLYVNGELLTEVGSPGTTKDTTVSNIGRIVFTAEAKDGVIEIVQQYANFVHRLGGYHSGWYVGTDWLLKDVQAADFAILLEMGAYLALFLFHILLFLMLPSYRPNLYFALFCFTWFMRMGTTEPSLFNVLAPWMNWQIKFRIEYVTVFIIIALVVAIIHEMFPGVLPKWARYICYISLVLCIIVEIFGGTIMMSEVAPFFLGFAVITAVFTIIRFIIKLRNINIEQALLLTGFAILTCVSIRDIVMYARRSLEQSNLYTEMTQVAVLACSLFAVTAFVIATMSEVARAKEAEQKLAIENAALDQVNRLKSDFMVNLSHELRTPLTIMSGYAQVTIRQIDDDTINDESKRNLTVISEEAQRLSKLAGGLLDTMREDQQMRYEAIEISTIIKRLNIIYNPLLKKNHNRFRIKIKQNLPPLHVNSEMIQQLLLNLVTNANKHTKNGTISIIADRIDDDGDFIKITVADTGTGISPRLAPHVFERNVSGDGSSGVGLAICKDIVQLHGGKITINSKPRRGTSVTFTLPITRQEDTNANDIND